MALIDKLTAIADAIRGKTGKTEEMTLDQMVTEIASISSGGGGGDESFWLGLISGEVTNLVTDKITKIRDSGFRYSGITSVDLPELITVGTVAFGNCSKLTSAKLPKLTSFPAQCFNGCSNLAELDLSNIVTLNNQALSGTGFTEIVLPNLTGLGSSVFNNCSKLKKVIFGKQITIHATGTFTNAAVLQTIVFRSETLCNLGNINAFNGTPFASDGTGGTIYVPQALIESYQTATNWSTLYAAGTCNFVAIEGSEYE